MRITTNTPAVTAPVTTSPTTPAASTSPNGFQVLKGSTSPLSGQSGGSTPQADSFLDNVIAGFKALFGAGKSGTVNTAEKGQLDAIADPTPTATPTSTPTPNP